MTPTPTDASPAEDPQDHRDSRDSRGAGRDGLSLVDPARPLRIHVVGVGGAGMSAIASVLATLGHTVSGSDVRASAATERLATEGIRVDVGHAAAHVAGADLVTASTAIAAANPELVEARRLGVPVWTRARTLAGLAEAKKCLAVAGTHGKTTTASMLALILAAAGLRPSFLIGGDVNEIGTNAAWDGGEWLVVEADESDGTFLVLHPEIAVVTNVDADHLDHYGSFAAVQDAFAAFLGAASEARVVGGDDPVAAALGRAAGATLVGTAPDAAYRMTDVDLGRSSAACTLVSGDGEGVRLAVPVPGHHNVANAAVAAVAARAAGVPLATAADALSRFAGVARRFEFRGRAGGVTLVDDYAHLPAEVRAALDAAVHGGWDRIVVVFQPHRYSRTAEVGADFGPCFAGTDELVVTDVYPAGEAPVPGVSGRLVADAAARALPDLPVHYVERRDQVAGVVAGLLQAGDLCLTLGAGDLTTLPDELLARPGW